jgi:hypothetical protein
VYSYIKDLTEKENYSIVQIFCREHPNKIAGKAIGSKVADGEATPAMATPALTGDLATWESTSG